MFRPDHPCLPPLEDARMPDPNMIRLNPNRPLSPDEYRARTERLRLLADYLARPIAVMGAPDDPDEAVVTADNLAREAALVAIRRAAIEG